MENHKDFTGLLYYVILGIVCHGQYVLQWIINIIVVTVI